MIKFITSLLVAVSVFSFGLAPVAVAQSAKDAVCAGVGLASSGAGCTDPQGAPTVNSTITSVVNILTVVVGLIAVVMIIVGGLKFITSGGSADKVAGARNTILYAVIGLVVVALAQVIVRFVINKTR